VKNRNIKPDLYQALMPGPHHRMAGQTCSSVLAVMKIQGNQIIAASRYHWEM
jgi:gentisate 1,2-dioxygenase